MFSEKTSLWNLRPPNFATRTWELLLLPPLSNPLATEVRVSLLNSDFIHPSCPTLPSLTQQLSPELQGQPPNGLFCQPCYTPNPSSVLLLILEHKHDPFTPLLAELRAQSATSSALLTTLSPKGGQACSLKGQTVNI